MCNQQFFLLSINLEQQFIPSAWKFYSPGNETNKQQQPKQKKEKKNA